ncbi:malonyl-CoA decarboxylase, mitochondrial isoform X2 [Dendrobium catenatum]|uniref:malonyl-CoA decarboxylase, mitochondrial isoform X2 n=1 Tax=Dendrobium catenatum TaxID=906689 RepID=UPI0009F71267|nr:malonyl-CoA decarboxylase, mitochondrial isoform X2 [Dendrobium catenatum]
MSLFRKGLAVLMRIPMKAAATSGQQLATTPPFTPANDASSSANLESHTSRKVALADVKEWMQASIAIPSDKIEFVDANLEEFSKGYLSLPQEGRRELLLVLARDYDVNRARVRELMAQYLNLGFPQEPESITEDEQSRGQIRDEAFLASCYRTERNLRIALKPMYDIFFERLNAYPGGLKILAVLRADLLLVIEKEKLPSLRALDLYLKERLITWLSPAALHLHQITWDDPASLLEKIVAYEAVHPIRSLQDLRRRLSTGRRCFGYFHSAIPGEPLIFIEVALLKEVAKAIQEVLWDDPPFLENEATCALFYSISSSQVFATLSPIPGYVQWLLSKLASHLKLGEEETENETDSEIVFSSTLKEHVLLPEEERMIFESGKALADGNSGIEILYNILSSTNSEWSKSECLLSALKGPLMRLCIRYLLEKNKSGKTLDAVANFHLQNGARIERINWMADTSERGIKQSAGIMVNYVYSLEKIEENAMAYFSTGHINASSNIYQCFQQPMEE